MKRHLKWMSLPFIATILLSTYVVAEEPFFSNVGETPYCFAKAYSGATQALLNCSNGIKELKFSYPEDCYVATARFSVPVKVMLWVTLVFKHLDMLVVG